MRPHQVSITKLMVAVLIVVANSAYLRGYGGLGTLVGTRLIVLILQAGFLGVVSGGHGARKFCFGFVVSGVLALAGWHAAAHWFPEATDRYFGEAMEVVLRRFPLGGSRYVVMAYPSHTALAEVLVTVPQLLLAIVGGIVCMSLGQRVARASSLDLQAPRAEYGRRFPEAPTMRLPRVRFTVRRLMVVVAAGAVILGSARAAMRRVRLAEATRHYNRELLRIMGGEVRLDSVYARSMEVFEAQCDVAYTATGRAEAVAAHLARIRAFHKSVHKTISQYPQGCYDWNEIRALDSYLKKAESMASDKR
jgi:hypothetical protein